MPEMTQQPQGKRATRWFGWLMGASRGKEAVNSQPLRSYNIYTSIDDLPFNRFKRLTIDQDLNALIIPLTDEYRDVRKEADKDYLLAEARDKVKEQFEEKMGGDDLKDLVYTVDDMETINIRIKRWERNLIAFLQYPTQEIIDMFTKEGFKYSGVPIDFANNVRNKIASLEIKLETKKALYEKQHSNDTTVISHEYYATIMAEIRKLEAWAVPDTITTLEFCIYARRLRSHYERLENDGLRTA
jgi:hypothetical protein